MFKKKQSFSLKLAPDFFVILVKAIAIVMVWRGVWNLLDTYLLPDYPIISNIICVVIGVFLLYLPDRNIEELI